MVKEEVNDPAYSDGTSPSTQKDDVAAPAPVAELEGPPAKRSRVIETEETPEEKDLEPEQFRKMFIGGLTAGTTDEMLRDYYSKWGELVDCVVMRDPNTKRSRGFGFVSFSKQSEVDLAMSERPHVIDNKSVDPKRAVPREQSQRMEANVSSKRLYVSGVRDEHSEEMFMSYFGKYGNVQKAEIIMDKNTGKPRGFAFITFDDHDAVDKSVLQKSHMINNYRCDVKKALSKEEMNKAQQSGRERMERGNRSRGNFRDYRQTSWGSGNDRGGIDRGGNDRGSSGYNRERSESWGTASAWGGPSGGQSGASAGWGAPSGRQSYGGGGNQSSGYVGVNQSSGYGGVSQSSGYGATDGYGGGYQQSGSQSWVSDGWAAPWGGQGWGPSPPGPTGSTPAWQGAAGSSNPAPSSSWNQNPPSGGHSGSGWGNWSGGY